MSAGSILLVADNCEMLDSFSRLLEQYGYETDATYHPLQRLMLAAERNYDVAVVDVDIPATDGLGLLDELVRLELFPVIVLSEKTCPIYVSRALEIGAIDYLVKPTAFEGLESSIKFAMSSRMAVTELDHSDV